MIDGEEAAGRAVFGRHIADGGAILERHVGKAFAIELDELADHALLAKDLGDGQHQIGGGAACPQLAGEAHTDDFRNQHGNGLAEHGRFRLDAADAPAQHRKPIDHGGMGIGPHQCVGIGVFDAGLSLFNFVGPHRLGQIFEIDLMTDAGTRRHHAEAVEALPTPA